MTTEHGYVGLSLEIGPNCRYEFLSDEITDSVYFSIRLKDHLSVISPVEKILTQ